MDTSTHSVHPNHAVVNKGGGGGGGWGRREGGGGGGGGMFRRLDGDGDGDGNGDGDGDTIPCERTSRRRLVTSYVRQLGIKLLHKSD